MLQRRYVVERGEETFNDDVVGKAREEDVSWLSKANSTLTPGGAENQMCRVPPTLTPLGGLNA